MIKKLYRLKENDVKKVLKNKKPFFAYSLVANSKLNNLSFSRFAIILSSKNTKGSINRNYFRRLFFELCRKYINDSNYDIVIVVKKWKIFDKRNLGSKVEFEKDIVFLLRKIFDNKNSNVQNKSAK